MQLNDSCVSLEHWRSVNNLRRSSLLMMAMSSLPCAPRVAARLVSTSMLHKVAPARRALASTKFCSPSLLSWRWYT